MNDDPTASPDFGTFSLDEANIAPEDQHYVDEILATDPLSLTAFSPEGEFLHKLSEPKLTTLDPEARVQVERQLAMVPASQRQEAEREFVVRALRERALYYRGRGVIAHDALPFHKEQAAVAAEIQDNTERLRKIERDLAEVARYDVSTDPHTGKEKQTPVLKLAGVLRNAALFERERLAQEIASLGGRGGAKRQAEALRESVALLKQHSQMVAEEEEVRRRSEELVREARINARAEQHARTALLNSRGPSL